MTYEPASILDIIKHLIEVNGIWTEGEDYISYYAY